MDSMIIWSKGSGRGVTVEVAEFREGGRSVGFGVYERIDRLSSLIFDGLDTRSAAVAAARDYIGGRHVDAHRVAVGVLEP